MLVLDESQFAWPQYPRPQGIPSRIQWIKTAFDAGTPIALVALPKFSEWQQLYAKRTLWDDDQLERRLNRKVPLPDAHSKEDLLKIARARHPSGDKASWTLLVGYALTATKKQASAIIEALESALDTAQQQGRDSITYEDIDAAVKQDFKPLPVPPVPSRKPAKTRPTPSHERERMSNLHVRSDRPARARGPRIRFLRKFFLRADRRADFGRVTAIRDSSALQFVVLYPPVFGQLPRAATNLSARQSVVRPGFYRLQIPFAYLRNHAPSQQGRLCQPNSKDRQETTGSQYSTISKVRHLALNHHALRRALPNSCYYFSG